MKKAFTSIFTLLILSTIAPIMAAPKVKSPFTAEVSLVAGNISLGEQTISEDGILHVKGAMSEGPVVSTSGPDISGVLWTSLDGTGDLNTGEGSFHGKWTITAVGGTFDGSVVGLLLTTGPITYYISGKFNGFGTGDYAGQKLKGSFEGDVTVGILQVELVMTGTISSKQK